VSNRPISSSWHEARNMRPRLRPPGDPGVAVEAETPGRTQRRWERLKDHSRVVEFLILFLQDLRSHHGLRTCGVCRLDLRVVPTFADRVCPPCSHPEGESRLAFSNAYTAPDSVRSGQIRSPSTWLGSDCRNTNAVLVSWVRPIDELALDAVLGLNVHACVDRRGRNLLPTSPDNRQRRFPLRPAKRKRSGTESPLRT
jgi:hypothetical protein